MVGRNGEDLEEREWEVSFYKNTLYVYMEVPQKLKYFFEKAVFLKL